MIPLKAIAFDHTVSGVGDRQPAYCMCTNERGVLEKSSLDGNKTYYPC